MSSFRYRPIHAAPSEPRTLESDPGLPSFITTDVFVQRFPEGGGRLKASVDGGGTPFWSPDGTRLYYFTVRPNAADSEVVEITFDGSGSTPVLGRPRTLFEVETISP